MTDDGGIEIAQSDDMLARFRLSKWHVQEVDGHDIKAVSAAILLAKKDPRPSMICCTTIIGRGLPGSKVRGQRTAVAFARIWLMRRDDILAGRTRASKSPVTSSRLGGMPADAACRNMRRGRAGWQP